MSCSKNIIYITTLGAGTYNKHPNLKYLDIICIAGGGGGGSGRVNVNGGNACGGQGGIHGSIARIRVTAGMLSPSENYYVGAGGVGGAAQVNNSQNGNAGAAGEDTYFGSHCLATRGVGGTGGTNGTSVAAVASLIPGILTLNTPSLFPYSLPTFSGTTTPNSTGTTSMNFAASNGSSWALHTGGSGGGLNTGNTATNGGVGSHIRMNDNTMSTANPGGLAGGGNGNDGFNNQLTAIGFDNDIFTHGIGTSGSGGGSANLTNAVDSGAGGNGGLYGAPGGGSGGARDTYDSGKGGDGAQGIIILVEYLG